jgi:uncharacterized phiE125 gp8 family phage protein
MALKLITGPETEPVSLTEAKLHLKVEHGVDDALITALITAAREQAEHITGRPFITQTWEQVLDEFPADELYLGKANVLAITSVKYIDLAGVEQTMDSADYSLDAESSPCWLLPAINSDWPDTLDTSNAVRVRFTCGYGAAAAVPEIAKVWMKLCIGKYHANREALTPGALVEMPGVDRILDPMRIWTP